MFLAAAPYFQTRFQSDPYLLANSQSAILAVSTTASLVSMLILTNIQSSASYPFRIYAGLLLNAAVFALLAISTSYFLDISASAYLAFTLLMVALTSWASGLIQNGALAFAASFGRAEYIQAIMAGQGVAGILPPLTQMISFLAFSPSPSSVTGGGGPDDGPSEADAPPVESSAAAFAYFLTAVLVSLLTAVAFVSLAGRHTRRRRRLTSSSSADGGQADDDPSRSAAAASAGHPRRFVSLATLLGKLRWVAASVFLCFAVAMFFPVFTAKVLSVHDPDDGYGRLFAPGAFIPLAFFFWNFGDLAGRVAAALPFFSSSLRRRPGVLLGIAVARVLFLPLYLLCNLHGDGAVVPSDLFYLLLVQFPFGLTNGWLGSSAMMAAGEWVADDEREAAGGFMGLCLVAGLAAGSLLSFTAAGI